MKNRSSGIFMISGMIVCWSVYYAVSKVTVTLAGSAFFAGFLLRSAAFIFLTAQLAWGGALKRLFSWKRTTYLLILIGILGFTQDICANLGYAGGNLSTGTALLKTDVLMTNIATVAIYRKRLFASDWAGTAVMLAGVLLVLGVDFGAMSFNASDTFFLLSAAALTANAFAVKAAQEKRGADPDTISWYNNFLVMTLSLAGAGTTGAVSAQPFSESGFILLVILGGLAQTGIYFFYYRNLRTHEVWTVKLYLLLIPVLSCFIGVFFLGEHLTALKAAGIITVLAGAAVILLRDRINSGRISEGR